MIGDTAVYNRFVNLDSIEERLINYLINSKTDNAERIWKLLKYDGKDALLKPNLTLQEKAELVDEDSPNQADKRVFRLPYLEDAFVVKSSVLRFYIDSVVPTNHLNSIVNIGIDILVNDKLSVIYNDANDELEFPDTYKKIDENIALKSRLTCLLKNILAEFNGKDIAGVGQLQFNQQLSPFSQARLGYFNNQNYFGYKVLIACMQSGVS